MSNLTFLKLGGSLITDKNIPHTPKPDTIYRIGNEIKRAVNEKPSLQLLIGHGSGSFGHVPAKKYNTRNGIKKKSDWIGMQKVWIEARALNQIIIEIFSSLDLPIIAFPPSAYVITSNRRVMRAETTPIKTVLDAGLIPIVNGDIIIDENMGATIYSTEEIFYLLTKTMNPGRVLIAGIENGVWSNYSEQKNIVKKITHSSYHNRSDMLGPSKYVDVTGGMREKVEIILNLINNSNNCVGYIFSGVQENYIYHALLGEELGTKLASD